MSFAKTVFRLGALSGVALIVACAPEIEGRFYMQDIQDVAESGTPVIVPAQLRIPESSKDDCEKGLTDLALKLQNITPISDQGECVEVDNNQFSQFSLDLPIVTADSTLDKDYLVILTVDGGDGSPGTGITLNLKMNRTLEDVQNAIGRGEDSGIRLSSSEKEHPKFIFTFENDGHDPVGLMPDYVFLDDEPGLPDIKYAVSLDRRESVVITFSDVVAAHIAQARDFTFATVYPGGI